MRTLTINEIEAVNGGITLTAKDFSYFMDKTVGYGATGVLAKMVLSGVTVAAGTQGFVIGASVGAAYAVVTLTAHALNIW